VITGADTRRRWSEETKAAIVAESFDEGAVVAQVARRHGLRPQQLFDWRRELRGALALCLDGGGTGFRSGHR
jgi:transposase